MVAFNVEASFEHLAPRWSSKTACGALLATNGFCVFESICLQVLIAHQPHISILTFSSNLLSKGSSLAVDNRFNPEEEKAMYALHSFRRGVSLTRSFALKRGIVRQAISARGHYIPQVENLNPEPES